MLKLKDLPAAELDRLARSYGVDRRTGEPACPPTVRAAALARYSETAKKKSKSEAAKK